MNTISLAVLNKKCSGCGVCISKSLTALDGIEVVVIELENDIVNVSYKDILSLELVKNNLI